MSDKDTAIKDRLIAVAGTRRARAFFIISPFLAGRRLIGWSVSLHFLTGRFVAQREDQVCGLNDSVSWAKWAVGWGINRGPVAIRAQADSQLLVRVLRSRSSFLAQFPAKKETR